MTTIQMPACLLPLEGVYNFRDMGGLRTEDGRTVKKGLLFRAAELAGLTPADHEALRAIGLKHVFDYRNRAEADEKPDPAIGEAIYIRVPANEAAESAPHVTMEQLFKSGMHKAFTDNMLDRLYASLPVNNASYKQLMSLLRTPETSLPLVHHCAGGRDRTGVGALIILLTLGVPYETILEDYLLSNVTLEKFHAQMFDMAAQYLDEESLETMRRTMALQARYLDASIDAILAAHGTFEQYLLAEFGIDAEARARIQAYCLEA